MAKIHQRRAEGMVCDAMCQALEFKKAVKTAEKQLVKAEVVVKTSPRTGKR